MYECIEVGTLKSKDGEEFTVLAGLDKGLVEQLKTKSLDEGDIELQKNTSDRKRFGEGSYEEWYSKERTPFALVDKSKALAAIAWFGPKPLGRKSLRYLSEAELAKEGAQDKTQWHTIVYRSYDPFRGRGLMTRFVQFALDTYRSAYPEAKFWAGMSTDNPASIGLASKLGFIVREDLADPEAHWMAMVLEPRQ